MTRTVHEVLNKDQSGLRTATTVFQAWQNSKDQKIGKSVEQCYKWIMQAGSNGF